MKKLLTTLIALILWMPLTASLDLDNCYISIFGGPNFIPDSKRVHVLLKPRFRGRGLTYEPVRGTKHFRTGAFGGIALGKKIESFRIESEISYRTNSLDRFKTNALVIKHYYPQMPDADSFIRDGNVELNLKMSKKIIKLHFHERLHTWALMFNGYYDFDCTSWCPCPLKPCVGIGLGIAFNHIHNFSWMRSGNIRRGRGNKRSDKMEDIIYELTWAWQVIAGLSYPIAESIDMGLEYRFFDSRIKKIHNHNLALLARYNF